MRRIVFILIVFCSAAIVSPAQVKKFVWDTPDCRNEGTYDSRKYTQTQLRNTLRLWEGSDFDLDTFDATVFKVEELGKLRTPASLEEEFKRKLNELKSLDIVKTPFWTEIKKKKIVSLEQQYELARVSVQAYENPLILRELKFADACVQKYAEPLIAGGENLLNAWREFNIESRKQNGSPETVRKTFEAQMQSPDRILYARVEMTTFAWWNCVNHVIDHGDSEKLQKAYNSLFKRVRKFDCEEP